MAHDRELHSLAALLGAGGVLALTGAGVSTDSGIPDYRGPDGVMRNRSPMTYQEFTGDERARRRHWARAHVGWRRVAAARPNAAHRALAALEHEGRVAGLITQNVDGLHTAAGSRAAVELHGNLDHTVCLDCGDRRPRAELAERHDRLNPDLSELAGTLAPDGDAELPPGAEESFVVAPCAACGGMLKPDVVFFGEGVPRQRVERCYAMVERARALLVVGSSLSVMSGYRFVRAARRREIPVAIVNRGPTRGDGDADLRIDAGAAEVLADLAPGAASPAEIGFQLTSVGGRLTNRGSSFPDPGHHLDARIGVAFEGELADPDGSPSRWPRAS